MINKDRDVKDVYKRVEYWLNYGETTLPLGFTFESFNLIFRNQILDKSLSLKEAEIVKDCKVFVALVNESSPQQF